MQNACHGSSTLKDANYDESLIPIGYGLWSQVPSQYAEDVSELVDHLLHHLFADDMQYHCSGRLVEASLMVVRLARCIADVIIIIIINEFHRDASLAKTSGPLCVTCFTSVNGNVAGSVRCRMIYGTVRSNITQQVSERICEKSLASKLTCNSSPSQFCARLKTVLFCRAYETLA